jgi:hypothetical protein
MRHSAMTGGRETGCVITDPAQPKTQTDIMLSLILSATTCARSLSRTRDRVLDQSNFESCV